MRPIPPLAHPDATPSQRAAWDALWAYLLRPRKEEELTTIIFKGCPRCEGDLILDYEYTPPGWNCMQCARVWDGAAEADLRRNAKEMRALASGSTR